MTNNFSFFSLRFLTKRVWLRTFRVKKNVKNGHCRKKEGVIGVRTIFTDCKLEIRPNNSKVVMCFSKYIDYTWIDHWGLTPGWYDLSSTWIGHLMVLSWADWIYIYGLKFSYGPRLRLGLYTNFHSISWPLSSP